MEIRDRLKARIEKRKEQLGQLAGIQWTSSSKSNETTLDPSHPQLNDSSTSIAHAKNQCSIATSKQAPKSGSFDYLTDICQDKKFNKKELTLILKVIKLELQPLIYYILFIQGILLWNNGAFSLTIFILLLYFEYVNMAQYLLGLFLISLSLLMISMKINVEKTTLVLALLLGFVIGIGDEDINRTAQNKTDASQTWYPGVVIQRAKDVKKKLQETWLQIGEFQYILYQFSIYIGKLRAVFFFKEEQCGQILCGTLAVLGLIFIVLPFRVFYVMTVILLFSLKPLHVLIKLKKKFGDDDEIGRIIKRKIENIQPDIPNADYAQLMGK